MTPGGPGGGGNGAGGNGGGSGGGGGSQSEALFRFIVPDPPAEQSLYEPVPDVLMVQVLPGGDGSPAGLAAAVGASVQYFNASTRTGALRVDPDERAAIATALAGRPEIESVDEDLLLPTGATPNDPMFASQWHLSKIGLPQVWDTTTGSDNLVIAIVDSGVLTNHPDLRTRLVGGYNFISNNTDSNDCCGHGTAVAGVAAAITGNAAGVAGATWGGRIMPIRVARDMEGKTLAATRDIARGIVWAVDHGADIINVSFAGMLSSKPVQTAAQYAAGSGRLVVAAMGNTGTRLDAADSPWMVGVSASDRIDGAASFSTFGPAVDLAAPGVELLSTSRDGGYAQVSGTSFAAPLTCGVAALLWSLRPDADATDIADLLARSALDLGPAGRDEKYGHGRIDAAAAMQLAISEAPNADTAPPQVRFTAPVDGSRATESVRVEVEATDDRLVREVVLSVDGVEQARDPSVPHQFLIDARVLAAGPHRVTALALDAAGNQSQEAALNLIVEERAAAAPPMAQIDGDPPVEALSGRIVTVTRVADPDGLARITMLINGRAVGGGELSGTSARVEFEWNASAPGLRPGRQVIGFLVVDQLGESSLVTLDATTTP